MVISVHYSPCVINLRRPGMFPKIALAYSVNNLLLLLNIYMRKLSLLVDSAG
jgi:hypothetical protein